SFACVCFDVISVTFDPSRMGCYMGRCAGRRGMKKKKKGAAEGDKVKGKQAAEASHKVKGKQVAGESDLVKGNREARASPKKPMK
nr:hypothetical protein [Tanacetum cinerariifolium]